MASTDFSNSEALSILGGSVSVFQMFELDAEPGFFEVVRLRFGNLAC
jgi:hypothetical protein